MPVVNFEVSALERDLPGLGLDDRQARGVLCTVRTLSAQRAAALCKAGIVALLVVQFLAVAVAVPLPVPT